METLAVWKFPLEIADSQTVTMPRASSIISAQAQGDVPTLWALVIPDAPKVKRLIRIIGTGHEFWAGEPIKFIGTVQTHGGKLVWHIFDGGEE